MAQAPDLADAMFLASLITKAREALGEAAFAASEAAGRARPYLDSLAEAREWLKAVE